MKKYIYSLTLFATIIISFLCITSEAATLKLNKTKLELQYGGTYTLKANQKVTWSSSNKKIVTVNSSGKLKAVGFGTAKIIAKTKKGKTKTCKVIVQNYVVQKTNNNEYPNKITVYYGNGSHKTYTVYNQKGYSDSWVQGRGCSACSIAIVASAYGQSQSPFDIHYGSPSKSYSERYALAKLGKEVKVNNKSLTVYSLTQMLNNTGIKCHAVYKYNNSSAIKQITKNLKAGRPVVIICHNKTVNGNRLATYIHFLVAVGIDSNGKAIVLNPAGGTVNKSHFTGSFSLTVSQLVKCHMFSCTGNNYHQFYYKQTKNAGGYILIDE